MATQRERSQATSTRLLTAARALFAAQGYAATAVDAIVARARVTKGAFYHHFEDKPAVFRAVLEAESQQLVAAAMSQRSGADPLSQFKSACFSYLRACLDPGVQRIGPSMSRKCSPAELRAPPAEGRPYSRNRKVSASGHHYFQIFSISGQKTGPF